MKKTTLYSKNLSLINRFKSLKPKKVPCDGCGSKVDWHKLRKVDLFYTRVCPRCQLKRQYR